MKAIYFFTALLYCSITYSQDVRTFYQTYSDLNFTTSMFEYNDEVYFVSIKDSSSASIKIVCGKLDENLNTSNYRYQYILSPSNGIPQLSGTAVNGNLLQLAILTFVNNTNTLSYITIDLTTFLVLSNVTEPTILNKNFTRSLAKDGHLITYASDNSGVVYRYDNDIVSFSNATSEIVDTLSLFGGYNYKQSCFEIVAGNEFVVGNASLTKMKFIKRDVQGNYSSSEIQFQQSIYSKAMTVLSNGNIVAANSNSYCILTNNLDSLSSGILASANSSNVSPTSKWAIYSHDNKIYEIRPKGRKYIYDINMNVLDSVTYKREFYPEGLFSYDGHKLLYGQVRNPAFFNLYDWNVNGNIPTDRVDLFIMKDKGANDFSEYGRTFIHDSIEFLTGSCGSSFMNLNSGINGYSYNVNGQKAGLIFNNSNQVIGKNSQNQLTGLYGRFNNNTNVLPGPVYSTVNDFNEQMDKYNRGYYVTKEMIEEHLTILFYGNPDYIAPHGIREWPAHGNVAFGEAPTIADFVDVNQNGIYEPMQGDYPKIYGDKCLLNIYHQNNQDPLNNDLEVHQYFFTYDCDTSEILRNTVFENMRVINRGGNMDSTFVGTFLDYDLGGPNDDYVGTNVELGMVYSYNGDALDLTDGGSIGFGTSVPAQGMLVLNGMKLKSNGGDNPFGVDFNESINGNGFNDGVIDNEYYTLESSHLYSNAAGGIYSDPDEITEYWNVLAGKFKDGSDKLFAPNIPIRYAMLGTSDPLFYATRGYDHGNNISEISLSQAPGDRRIMGGSGPGLFAAGDTINYLTAHITSFDPTDTSVPISTDKLFADATWLKQAYKNNDLGCGNTFGTIQEDLSVEEEVKYDFNLYPNPFSNELYLSNLSNEKSQIEIYNLEGKSVYSTSISGMKAVLSLELQVGLYFIHVSNENGSAVKRIVKN